MKLARRQFLQVAAAAAVLPGAARRAGAQSYATQPIRILVGYAAGGGVDMVARLLGEPMKAALGQTILVENRTGAAAMIAANAVAKAAPDGHTLLMAASGEVAINQHVYKDKMTYDPARELVPIALIGIVPCVVVVAAGTPVRTPQELIAYAKANPGKLSFSSSGVSNPQHLAGELMNAMAGTDVLHVPYRGAAPAVTDVATGAVTMSEGGYRWRGRGRSRNSRNRFPTRRELRGIFDQAASNVAPLSEGAPGLAGYELLNWFGMFGTGGTPAPIVARLNAIVTKALAEPRTAELLDVQGIVPRPMTAAEYKAFVEAETRKFAAIIERAGIKLEG